MTKVDKSSHKVEAMFNSIASKYDSLNHLLSFGIDKRWRKILIRELSKLHPQQVLDVATGTADLAIQLARYSKSVEITGIDISAGMLEKGRSKVAKKGLSDRVKLKQASAGSLPFASNTFDAAMVAFGVRNFEDLSGSLMEIGRTLKPKAKLFILEFSKPIKFPFAQIYRLYFKHILPFIGGIVSGNKRAYRYLFESVMEFPEKKDFVSLMEQAGFVGWIFTSLTFGIASIYIGEKQAVQ